MNEAELEQAICRSYPVLIPDLFAQGFRIRSSQAVLFRRRLDLVLQTDDGKTCIIELKVGVPKLRAVRTQILDYAFCWKTTFRSVHPPRLMLISNLIPPATKTDLANYGIETRIITELDILAALQHQGSPPPQGLNFTPEDATEEIRKLLSDYDVITVPDGLILAAPWNHQKVFLALVERGESYKSLWLKNPCVRLYDQKPNCALLYAPGTTCGQGPLHLNPRTKSWKDEVIRQIEPHIQFKIQELKPSGFDEYVVSDWDGFASGLGLDAIDD